MEDDALRVGRLQRGQDLIKQTKLMLKSFLDRTEFWHMECERIKRGLCARKWTIDELIRRRENTTNVFFALRRVSRRKTSHKTSIWDFPPNLCNTRPLILFCKLVCLINQQHVCFRKFDQTSWLAIEQPTDRAHVDDAVIALGSDYLLFRCDHVDAANHKYGLGVSKHRGQFMELKCELSSWHYDHGLLSWVSQKSYQNES